ncbi:putative RNA-directed DNA polymerase from transposon BS, partial [Frankliniella fusca]
DILLLAGQQTTFILGDYNIDFNRGKDRPFHECHEIMKSMFFEYLFTDITRPTLNGGSCIDNVVTNSKVKVQSKSIVPIDFSDHNALKVNISILEKIRIIKYKQETRRINEGTLNELNYLLAMENWGEVMCEDDPEEAYNNFITTFTHNYNITCPKYWKSISCKKDNYESDRGIVHCKALLSILKQSKPNENNSQQDILAKIKKCKRQLRKAHDQAMKNYNSKKIREANNVSKETWNIIKKLKTTRESKIDQIVLNIQGKPCNDPKLVSNVFNEYYANVPIAIKEKLGDTPFNFDHIKNIDSSIYLEKCTEKEVLEAIDMLATKNSAGIDEISNRVLKSCTQQVTQPLTCITNLCLEKGCFPTALKGTLITPLYKKSDKLQPKNYRPIAANSPFSKGSILGPYLFIIYTNCIQQLVKELGAEAIVYVDDTNIIVTADDTEELFNQTEKILRALKGFFASLNLELNWEKTVYMTFDRTREDKKLILDNITIQR